MLLCIEAFAGFVFYFGGFLWFFFCLGLFFFFFLHQVGMPGELGTFQKQDCRAPWVTQSALLQKQEETVALGINSCWQWLSRVTCQGWTIGHKHIISVFSGPVTVLQLLSYKRDRGMSLAAHPPRAKHPRCPAPPLCSVRWSHRWGRKEYF